MDGYTIYKIAELLKNGEWDDPITDIKIFHNMEYDPVVSYEQDGQKKLITIDIIEDLNETKGDN